MKSSGKKHVKKRMKMHESMTMGMMTMIMTTWVLEWHPQYMRRGEHIMLLERMELVGIICR